jgi:hypothetical protein
MAVLLRGRFFRLDRRNLTPAPLHLYTDFTVRYLRIVLAPVILIPMNLTDNSIIIAKTFAGHEGPWEVVSFHDPDSLWRKGLAQVRPHFAKQGYTLRAFYSEEQFAAANAPWANGSQYTY